MIASKTAVKAIQAGLGPASELRYVLEVAA